MANIRLYRGGTPDVKYVWERKDWAQFRPPFGIPTADDTPPYDSHADGAYNLGNFVQGLPLKPRGYGLEWQRKALADAAAGDVLQMIWLPADHYATALNLKSIDIQENLSGATIALISQILTRDADGNEVVSDTTDLDDAIAAQGGTNVFDLSKPFNAFVSLMKADTGYAVPLYSQPPLPAADAASSPTYARFIVFGVKILSLPTDADVALSQMFKGVYLSVRSTAFECPTNT